LIVAPPEVISPANDPSAVAPSEPRSTPAAVETPGQTSTTPVGQTPAVSPTPLLDAANRRIAAVTRQQSEPRDASATSAGPEVIPALVTQRSPVKKGSDSVAGTAPRVLRTTVSDPFLTSEPPSSKDDASPVQPPAPAAQQEKEKEKRPEEPAPDQSPVAGLTPAVPVSRSAPEDDAAPEINDLRLCRGVSGFGSFEPLNETSVKAGQHLLIYCEMTGLRYEAKDDGYVSRISSRIEIRPAGGGPTQWDHELGAAEDVCRRRRHDYYVNYRVDLPRSLAPGSYNLRLTQTDLIANHSTAAEIPLVVTP